MSILADSKILELFEKGEVVIRPFNRKQLGSNSYDVLLDDNLIVYKIIYKLSTSHSNSEFLILNS